MKGQTSKMVLAGCLALLLSGHIYAQPGNTKTKQVQFAYTNWQTESLEKSGKAAIMQPEERQSKKRQSRKFSSKENAKSVAAGNNPQHIFCFTEYNLPEQVRIKVKDSYPYHFISEVAKVEEQGGFWLIKLEDARQVITVKVQEIGSFRRLEEMEKLCKL